MSKQSNPLNSEPEDGQASFLASRRDFLKQAGAVLAVLAVPGAAADDDDDVHRGNKAASKGQVDVGAVSSFALGSVSDKTAVAGVVISRTAQGLIALAPVCTHQGCPPVFSSAAAQFVCRCHGARFSTDGAVTAGPARTPLSRCPISIKNGRVIVNTDKLVQRSLVKASDFVKV